MLDFISQYQYWLLAFLMTVLLSFFLTRIMLAVALNCGWVAASNERSSHVGKLAFGGGASVIGVGLGVWVFLAPPISILQIVVLMSVLALAAISWVDDLKNLPTGLRMAAHLIAVVACLFCLPEQHSILPFQLPIFLDRLFAGFFWLWFINLFNFMDGIDGLAGVETVFVSLGAFIVGILGTLEFEWSLLALIISGAALGFLPWNWHRARIMLGDLGSVPIGFLLGFLLIQISLGGYWMAALILPGYFIVDATLTILRRLLNHEKIWHPHRTHLYQRACKPNKGHGDVVVRVLIGNIGLFLAGVLSMSQPVIGGMLAVVILAGLIFSLVGMAIALQ